MNDIKSYVIGFLSCACLFLIMGQSKQTMRIDGKVHVNPPKYQFAVQRGIDIGETYYLYDNENDEVKMLNAFQNEGKTEWASFKINFGEKYKEGKKASMDALKKYKALQGKTEIEQR